MYHHPLRMADGEAACLFHIGGSKKVGIRADLDLLSHQARRAEFRGSNRIGRRRKTAQQICERGGEAARAGHVQGLPRRRQRESQKQAQACKISTHCDHLRHHPAELDPDGATLPVLVDPYKLAILI
jgi:hypothetical protein